MPTQAATLTLAKIYFLGILNRTTDRPYLEDQTRQQWKWPNNL